VRKYGGKSRWIFSGYEMFGVKNIKLMDKKDYTEYMGNSGVSRSSGYFIDCVSVSFKVSLISLCYELL
jgi:hypothetical protein